MLLAPGRGLAGASRQLGESARAGSGGRGMSVAANARHGVVLRDGARSCGPVAVTGVRRQDRPSLPPAIASADRVLDVADGLLTGAARPSWRRSRSEHGIGATTRGRIADVCTRARGNPERCASVRGAVAGVQEHGRNCTASD